MKTILLFFGLALALVLNGCSAENNYMEVQKTAAENGEAKSANLHLLDKELEEISAADWESLHLSKSDFDQFLSGLTERSENGLQQVAKVEMKAEDIRLVLDNNDGETLDNLMAAPFLDTKVRQAYLQSAYFNGQQPMIVIMDGGGTVLSETNEPLELADP